ncbi:MAG: potassium channel family protein [Syntrophobacterales bacterium]|nr:potassium channel family protein [Syntrophobacterales bacterium]
MNHLRLPPHRLRFEEAGLTGLLIFFLGYFIVLNSLSDFGVGRILALICFSLIIITGVVTTFRQRWLSFFVILLAVVLLALNWLEEFRPGRALALASHGLSLIFLATLLAVVIAQVFQEGPVTGHRIRGAVTIYLLLGVLWAIMYQLIALIFPQAFRLPAALPAGDPEALRRELTYFSFITLTTTGYGDITAVHPVARTLVMLEALAGQLYPAIVLAWLVSLAVMDRQDKSTQ